MADNSISDRINLAVKGHHLGFICQVTGLSAGTLYRYRMGRIPKADVLSDIADACRVNLMWLTTGEGPMAVESFSAQDARKAEAGRAAKAEPAGAHEGDYLVNKIPPGRRTALLDHLLGMAFNEKEKGDISSYIRGYIAGICPPQKTEG